MDSAYNNKTNDESKIVRLRSTTGIHRTPPSEILDMNNAKLSRGEFWMPFRSWVNTFTHLEVVHLDGDTSRDEPSLQDKIPWVVRLYQGQWRKGVSAGGCRNFTGILTLQRYKKKFEKKRYCELFYKSCTVAKVTSQTHTSTQFVTSY